MVVTCIFLDMSKLTHFFMQKHKDLLNKCVIDMTHKLTVYVNIYIYIYMHVCVSKDDF